VQELAFTLANGKAYVKAALEQGLDIDVFGKRLSFFFNAHNHLFEEVAKFRAARRIWASMMKEMGATAPEAMMLRFHTQTGGSTLTAQQPDVNIVRVAIQSMAAVLGGTQSLHTNGFDEALGLPTQDAARIALRTQQVVAHESGITDTVDPLGGSYFIENLTDQMEKEARNLIALIDDMGGAVTAVEQGWMQDEIARSSYSYQKEIDNGKKVIVGVNAFNSDQQQTAPPILKIDDNIRHTQTQKLQQLKSDRNQGQVQANLAQLSEAARNGNNLMPHILTAVESYATLGEIADVLRQEFGEYKA
jgi:methylmalonyl-CoA mutase N-terminal domain/subunit